MKKTKPKKQKKQQKVVGGSNNELGNNVLPDISGSLQKEFSDQKVNNDNLSSE